MIALALWATLATLCFSVAGAPLTLWMGAFDSRSRAFFSLLLAPACGMSFTIAAAVWLHFLGVGGRAIFALILLVALIGIALVLRFKRVGFSVLIAPMGAIAAGAFLGTLINGTDYYGFSLNDYFPLTNDDTFTYLGFIDQIRIVGWYKPIVTYPAGYLPVISEFVYPRFPGNALVAGVADLFGLESHVAFFLVQRLSVPVIALAAAGLAGWLTGRALAAWLCLSMMIAGNFLLHQSLQQFNSSLMGGVVAVPLLWVVGWSLVRLKSQSAAYVGIALSGVFAAILAMASPEASVLYLLALGLLFIGAFSALRQWSLFAFIPVFVVSFVIALYPVAPALSGFLLHQSSGRLGSGPGDWLASPAILLQYSGVRFVLSPSLFGYPILIVLAAFVFVATLVVSLAWLIKVSWCGGRDKLVNELPLFCVTIPGSMFLAIQIGLYAAGMGYILLKTIDYSTFLVPILIAVIAEKLLTGFAWHHLRVLAAVAIAAVWFPVVIVEKAKILGSYRAGIVAMPKYSDYVISKGSLPPGVQLIPDFDREVLDLFLYANRFGSDQIIQSATVSNRFQFVNLQTKGAPIVARLGHTGAPGRPIADITGKAFNAKIIGLQLSPAAGEVLIQPGNGWLDPEGPSIASLFRWLGGSGNFVILGQDSTQNRVLKIDMRPGPDLKPTNSIEILVADRVLTTLNAEKLPATVTLQLPLLSSRMLTGVIRILGPQVGPRQVSVVSVNTVHSGGSF